MLRSTALFLLGWLAGQLRWELKTAAPLVFGSAAGGSVAIQLEEKPGPALSGCHLTCGGATFALHRASGERYLHADIALPGGQHFSHLLPAGPDTTLELLEEEMTRGARQTVYLRALSAITPLF